MIIDPAQEEIFITFEFIQRRKITLTNIIFQFFALVFPDRKIFASVHMVQRFFYLTELAVLDIDNFSGQRSTNCVSCTCMQRIISGPTRFN